MIGLRAGITIAIAAILCAALGLIGWGAQRAAEHTIVPAILVKAESVGRSAAALVERADAAGIPLDHLVGVAAYFDELRAANAEFAELRLSLAGAGEAARSGSAEGLGAATVVRVPVTRAGAPVGEIAITIDPSVVGRQVAAVLLDVAFIGVVALLVALELVALVVGTRGIEAVAAVEQRLRALARGRLSLHQSGAGTGAEPLLEPVDTQVARLGARHARARAEAGQRGDAALAGHLDALAERTGLGEVVATESRLAGAIRPALFLFMLAEELTRPFLPRLAQALAPAGGGLSPDTAASLPIVAFMAVVAAFQIPFAGLSERLGRRSGFAAGALLAAAGYALSAVSHDYVLFLGARIVAGVGYALVFVSAQGHVVDHSHGAGRSAALAVFVRAIMVACLCGPPIGGVIADRLGPSAALGASAALALVALGVVLMVVPRGVPRAVHATLSVGDLLRATRAPRLMALLVGCAFPAKLLFAALCLLLVPLELQRQGYSAAAIGRFQMIYPLVMVLAVPVFAALADRLKARAAFVVAGGLVSGLGALAVPLYPSVGLIVFALAMLGLGQALSIASQSALVADTAAHSGFSAAGVLGLFRLVERSGNAAGPAGAGILLAAAGFSVTTALMGAVVVAGAVVFALSGRRAAAPSGSRRATRAATSEGSPV
ncbi:MFS transporter [Xanthobacter sp. V4C-4]|uniref:MFS transporter n=1 Tax=Xanthobacter cornucopiae TaxID=3119924 RepID=UPI00372A8228